LIVNTQTLFVRLLPRMGIDVICDVGSMDGADALRFRSVSPRSRIYAFEPNPDNLRRMQGNRVLQERNIQVVPLAATNHDGDAEFFVVAATDEQLPLRGMSSLYARSGQFAPSAVVRIGTTRLDTFLADKCSPRAQLALWIDVEGKAYEVIEGLAGVGEHVQILHIEVESSRCIGADQKLYSEVKPLLQRLGFAELATDHPPECDQFNAVFVRRDLPPRVWFKVKASLVAARLRFMIVSVVRTMCPACLRRYQMMRRRAVSRQSGLPI
jgi:FkbM family methyltransferase